MTVPGVGPLVAVTFKSTLDDPTRITKSKAVGALFGLSPKPAGSRGLAMKWFAQHSMKPLMFCYRG
jgi:transposase